MMLTKYLFQNEEVRTIKRLTSFLFILMFMFVLMGNATTVFAGPGKDNSKACENASDKGKANANSNSALGNCDETPPADEPPAEEPPAEEPPAEDPPAEETSGGECSPLTPEFC